MKLRPPSPGLVVALLALIVAMGSTAVAASFITSAQIKDGTIQAKDLSKKARTSLRGTAGPRGPAGAAGAAGVTGAAGARGPSDAFVFTHPANIALPNTATPLVAPLAPGTYVIVAKLQVNNDSAVTARPFCRLAAGADEDTAEPGTNTNSTSADTAIATLVVAHTFTSAGSATLSCDGGGSSPVVLQQVTITAIQVATVTARAI